MNKFECDLVADLLPGYIENRCSLQTKAYIEDHIKSCDECRKIYKAMTSEMPKIGFREPVKKKFRINGALKLLLFAFGYIIVVIIGLVILSIILTEGVL